MLEKKSLKRGEMRKNRLHFMVRINQRYFKTVDPGGTMLAELMDARVDIQGVRHNSISERLLADMDYLYQKLENVCLR